MDFADIVFQSRISKVAFSIGDSSKQFEIHVFYSRL